MPNRSIEGNLTLIEPNDRLLWMGILYELNERYHFEEELLLRQLRTLSRFRISLQVNSLLADLPERCQLGLYSLSVSIQNNKFQD
jgi:hypothetical protein